MVNRYPIHSSAPTELQEVCTTPEINTVDGNHDDPCPIDFRVIAHR